MDSTPHWLPPVAVSLEPPSAATPTVGHGPATATTELHASVVAAKNEIDCISPDAQWDDAKKITNSYEYIFLSLQRRMNRSVSAVQPLSRSYFKMLEFWQQLHLDANRCERTAHTAEGPGGFLEAIQFRTGGATAMTAMTLRSTEKTIPGWRKSAAFLHAHPGVHITYGADGTGNLYSAENQSAFAERARYADIYTADGGFDFSADFNGQENTVQRLLAAEALAGVRTLKVGGQSVMIIKVFDTCCRATLELLWTLTTCFDSTALMKPRTSRPANSERYWIGRGFRGAPAWICDLLTTMTTTPAEHGWIQLFAEPPWSSEWLAAILAFQSQLETAQIAAIKETLALIRAPSRERIRELLRRNIECSRAWCEEHGIPENPAYRGATTASIVAQNLEEALVPFPALASHTHSPERSQQPQTHRGLTVAPLPPIPAGGAWRSALPQSVRDYRPSRTASEDVPSTPPETDP